MLTKAKKVSGCGLGVALALLWLASPAHGVEKVVLTFDPDGDGNSDLYMASLDGTNMVNLTPGSPQNEQSPCISPDGTRVVAGSPSGHILVYDLRTSNANYFKPNNATDVVNTVWRTNSEILFHAGFSGGTSFSETWACAPDGSNTHQYIDWRSSQWPGPPAGVGRLSRDGQRLGGGAQDGYWAPTEDVFTLPAVAAPTPDMLQWAYVSPDNDKQDQFCDFLPDGDIVMRHHLQGYPASPEYTVVARTAPGSGVLTYLTSTTGFVNPLAATDDGAHILYQTWQTDFGQGESQIWAMDANGLNKRLWLAGLGQGWIFADAGFVVPEPMALVMLATGSLMTFGRRRR